MSESKESSSDDQLQHLRDLLISAPLSELREEINDKEIDAEKLSRILPEAIHSADGSRLANAIEPTFSDAFSKSVKRNPQALADAVSPIMGPAIQGYIRRQIQAMIQSLQTTLDQSLSPKSFRWRIESWRTGKPFAEIVLLHTLIYRIEQVLLIDPETGLLMQSVSSDARDEDADLVSSLLSAIQDFMRDSFRHRSEEGSELQDMKTNELTVWLHHGPAAVLAVAIRGQAPITLRERVQAVLDRIHVDYGSLLSNFRGDTTPMDVIQPDLEELIESEFVGKTSSKSDAEQGKSAPWWQRQMSWAVPTVLLLLLVGGLYYRQRNSMFDEIARVLDVPPGVQIEVKEDTLRISGSARQNWIDKVQNRFERLPQFTQLDLHDLVASDAPWQLFVDVLKSEEGVTVNEFKRVGKKYYIYGWRFSDSADPKLVAASIIDLDPNSIIHRWEIVDRNNVARSSQP